MSSLPGSPVGPQWREVPVTRASLYVSFWIPINGALRPGSPNRSLTEGDVPILEPSFNYLSKFPVNGPPNLPRPHPGFTTETPGGDRQPFPEPSSTHPLIKTKSHLPSISPVRVHPPYSPQKGPCGERWSVFRASGLFIHLYLSESPVKEPCHEIRGKYTVTVHEAPRVRPYIGVRPDSCSHYPSAVQPAARYLPRWLG